MSKQIAQLSNLMELIETGMITVASVQCETTISSYITEADPIAPTEFIESLQYLNEAKYFRDGIDFFYDLDEEVLIIKAGMKSPYMREVYIAHCVLKDGVSAKEVDTELRKTIFDKMDKKFVSET